MTVVTITSCYILYSIQVGYQYNSGVRGEDPVGRHHEMTDSAVRWCVLMAVTLTLLTIAPLDAGPVSINSASQYYTNLCVLAHRASHFFPYVLRIEREPPVR